MDSKEDHDYHARRRYKCSSKNAIVARQNRIKKKEYLKSLEEKLSQLSGENADLRLRLDKNDKELQEIRLENKYLRSVFANRKEIEKLLRVVKIGTGLDVTTSLNQRSRVSSPPARYDQDLDEDISVVSNDVNLNSGLFSLSDDAVVDNLDSSLFGGELDVPALSDSDFSDPCVESADFCSNGNLSDDVGICLHVSKRRASLELCAVCSNSASSAWKAEMKIRE